MGRRATHTADELKDLILVSARDIVVQHGLAGLSARTIARRIGYSPGTLYNVFEHLDDLILHVEARMLDELNANLADVAAQTKGAVGTAPIRALAKAYLAFTAERPRLWNLLFEHHLPVSLAVPDWYRDKLNVLLGHVETALQPAMPHRSREDVRLSARVLWSSIHGISSLATGEKLSVVTQVSTTTMVDDLLSTYLGGLQANQRIA
jgi:AcrR family transcriptional regulator